MAQFIPSPQQNDYFIWIVNGEGSAIVEAVAGAGKTKTLIEGLRRQTGHIFFGAYNKAISVEIKERVAAEGLDRKGLFIGTFHASGFGTWRRSYPNVRVDDKKVRNILDDALLCGQIEEWQMNFSKKLISIGKQLLLPLGGGQAWLNAVEHFGLDEELPEDADVAKAVMNTIQHYITSRQLCQEVIDFDDMIYAPLSYKCRFWKNDWVLGDEWQDSNPARRRMVREMLKPDGRFVGVGDSRQAIYGFTGASSDALEISAKEHNCTLLPLTVTFRCPKAVVNHAHQWVKHIQAHETAPEGLVRGLLPTPKETPNATWYTYDKPGPDDFVICRFTKPLIETAYGMLKVGHACRVEGRDIGNGLVTLARRWKVKTLDALEGRLEKYLDREISKARAKKSETAEQIVQDKVDTLRIFIGRCREKGGNTIDCVVAEIEALFADDVTGVTTLLTGHKSKGRERPVVYWIQGRVTRALKDWEEVQEDNIAYVITTRAQETLVLVPEPGK